jgi:chromate reductase
MKILALCGSLRAVSQNATLLRAAARLAPAGITVDLYPTLAELPLFNPDLEGDLPDPVRRLHAEIARCDALLIASPEYAHGVTGVIKNALDWLVSFEGFVGKRVAIFNASPGSLHAEPALREILVTMSANLVTAACLALPLRGTRISEQGIVDSEHAGRIRAALLLLGS